LVKRSRGGGWEEGRHMFMKSLNCGQNVRRRKGAMH
jgi:hypothetical protein